MTTTQNLHLPQWEDSDRIRRDDFNEAFDKIDAGVKAATDAAAAAAAGGAKVAAGSYVGTGTSGASNPRTLSFNFQPKIVFLIGWNHSNHLSYLPISTFLVNGFGAAPVLQGTLEASGSSNAVHTGLTVTFSGNSVSFYGTHQYNHFNYSGVTYHYVAIG